MEDTNQAQQPKPSTEEVAATSVSDGTKPTEKAEPAIESKQKPVESSPPKPNVPIDEIALSTICYIPFLALLASPLAIIKKPESKFCEFHASQGLVLFVVWFLSLFLAAFLPPVLGGILWMLLLFGSVFALVKALSGYEYKIPGLAAIAVHIPVKNFFVAVKKGAGVQSGENLSEEVVSEAASVAVPSEEAVTSSQQQKSEASETPPPPAV